MSLLDDKKVNKAVAKAEKAGLKGAALTAVETAASSFSTAKEQAKAVKAATKFYKSALKANYSEAFAEEVAARAAEADKAELKNIKANIKAVKAAVKAGLDADYIEAISDNITPENAKVFAQLTKQLKKDNISKEDAVKLAAAVKGFDKKETKDVVKDVKQAVKKGGGDLTDVIAKHEAKNEGEGEGEGGTTVPGSLTEALENLKAAQDNLDKFLFEAGQDETTEGEDPAATPEDITDALAGAKAAVADVLTGAADLEVVEGDYADASDAVQAALIADAKAKLEAALTKAQEDVAKQEAEIAKVSGLNAAITAYENAVAAAKAAEVAQEEADLLADAENAKFGTLNAEILDGESVENIVELKGGAYVLKTGLTASDYVGLDVLLSAINASYAAETALESAEIAKGQALIALNFIDKTAATIAAEETVAELIKTGDKTTTLGAIETHTLTLESQALTAIRALKEGEELKYPEAVLKLDPDSGAYAAYATAEADEAINFAGETPDAFTVLNTFAEKVGLLMDELYAELGQNGDDSEAEQLSSVLLALKEAITNPEAFDEEGDFAADSAGIQDFIDALDAALAKQEEAAGAVAQLVELKAAITAAEKVFGDNEWVLPKTVDVSNIATTESDIFIVGDKEGTITNFGKLGDDVLFVGKGYTLVALGEDTIQKSVGDASALEIFYKEDATGLTLYVEQEAFGGNLTGGMALGEVVEVKLTGVKFADITDNLADGYLSA